MTTTRFAFGAQIPAERGPLGPVPTSAALFDYLFKTKAVEAVGTSDHLPRFFALYYAAIGLITLPDQPLQVAFRSLRSEDRRLRPSQPHAEIIATLLRSSSSITLQGLARKV